MTENQESKKTDSGSLNGWWTGGLTAVLFFALGLFSAPYLIPGSVISAPVEAAVGIGADAETLAAIVRSEVRTALQEAQPAALARAAEPQRPAVQPGSAQTQGPQQPQPVSNISEDDDPALGPKDAQVVIVEFTDYQ